MQSLHKLYVIVTCEILLWGCDRAKEDSSQIVIKLPLTNNAAGLKSVVSSISVLSSTAGTNSEEADEFLSIVPTDFAGSHPINCYAVFVTGPDSIFKRNYCGKTNPTTGLVGRDIEFGDFVGLRTPGSEIVFNLDPGAGRQFHILGLHATSATACQDLSLHPTKSDLSRPFYLGASAPIDLKGGTIDVPIQMSLVNSNNYYDDCELQTVTTPSNLPLADHLDVESRAFPFQQLRKTPTGSYVCEPIDIYPKSSTGPGVFNSVMQAELLFSTTTSAAGSFSVRGTYDNNADCAADVSDNFAKDSFGFLANQSMQRRWVKLDGLTFTGSHAFFSSRLLGGTGAPNPLSFDIFSTMAAPSTVTFDHILPRKIFTGQCYHALSVVKSMDGDLATGTSYGGTHSVSVSGALAVYGTLNSCQNEGTQLSMIYTSGANYKDYWIRANTALSSPVAFSVNSSGAQGYNYPTFVQPIATSISLDLTPKMLEFKGKNFIRGGMSAVCSPVYIQILNSSGAAISASTSGEIKFIPTASNMADYQIFSDSNCSMPMSAASSVIVPIGDFFGKVYIKSNTVTTSTWGPRAVQFIYNNSVYGKFNFTFTDPNY